MQFTVTYRGADGAVVTEAVEAASRGECFAQMKARGISPMRVEKGRGKQPSHTKTQGRGGGGALKWVLAFAVVLALGGGLLWWFAGHEVAVPKDVGPKKPGALAKEVTPVVATKNPVVAVTVPATDASTNKASLYPSHEHSIVLKRPVVAFSAQTNANGRVVETIRTDDGKIHTNIYSLKPPTFESGTDEQLAIAVSTRPGEMPPPMLPVDPADEKVFLESIKKPIKILDSDTAAIRELKERVIKAREDMAQMMAQGHTFEEVLKENRKLQEENAITRQGVVESLKKILAEGDIELAREFVKESNAVLDQMGIMRVALPADASGETSVTKGDLMRKRRKENVE